MQWEYRTPSPRGSEYFSPPARLLRLGLDAPARPIWLLDPDVLFDAVSTHPAEGPVFPWLPQSMLGFNSRRCSVSHRYSNHLVFGGQSAGSTDCGGKWRQQHGEIGPSLPIPARLRRVLVRDRGSTTSGAEPELKSTIPPVGAVFTLIWAAITWYSSQFGGQSELFENARARGHLRLVSWSCRAA